MCQSPALWILTGTTPSPLSVYCPAVNVVALDINTESERKRELKKIPCFACFTGWSKTKQPFLILSYTSPQNSLKIRSKGGFDLILTIKKEKEKKKKKKKKKKKRRKKKQALNRFMVYIVNLCGRISVWNILQIAHLAVSSVKWYTIWSIDFQLLIYIYKL